MFSKPLPVGDLEAILFRAKDSFQSLRGARIFIAGGTGFFGHWLLESLLQANRVEQLGIQATVLTRNEAAFRQLSPWIAEDAAITILEGDIGTFKYPVKSFTHIIHAAADSGGLQQRMSAAELHASVVNGTKHMVAFARFSGVSRMLYISSGAVYGQLIPVGVTEDFPLPSIAAQDYASAKRLSERSCIAQVGDIGCVIARCFAFVGPRLPLDQHFAIGNFIRDSIAGKRLTIRGDGSPLRSWLYMSDLAVWLWTLLVRGESGRTYNVGSDEGYSIRDAAKLTATTLNPSATVEVLGTSVVGAQPDLYVPNIQRAQTELGLQVTVPLAEALRRTADWYRQ